MTEQPQQLLAESRALTRSVRRTQGAGWFALLVFGLVTALSAPFFRYGPHFRHCGSSRGFEVCTVYPLLVLWYWPVALVLGYAVIGRFYLLRSRARGVGTRVQPYVVGGVVLGVLAGAWAAWAFAHPVFLAQSIHLGQAQPTSVLFRLTSPPGVIGLALLGLAWIERAWLLGVVTVVYLALVGSNVPTHHVVTRSPWVFLPHLLLTAGVLLVGAPLVGLVRRGTGRPAA